MDAEDVASLQSLIEAEKKDNRIVLDLNDLTLVDLDAVRFLKRCEENRIKLANCPTYIRVWIERERSAPAGVSPKPLSTSKAKPIGGKS